MNRSRPRSLRSLRRTAAPRRTLTAGLLAATLCFAMLASPAHASFNTMQRSLTNIVLGPVDLVLTPLTTATGIYQNLRDIDDSPGVRFVYPLPAFIFAFGTNAGGAMLRLITGLVQLPVAIPLMFMEADLDSMIYSPAEDARALYENEVELWEDQWLPIRFGLNYTINDY